MTELALLSVLAGDPGVQQGIWKNDPFPFGFVQNHTFCRKLTLIFVTQKDGQQSAFL